ncbi:PQQ-dependent sugar dehydrogenase [Micromonospora thermarum]|uniref:PQQ-dependent sugar dehydrogenase n=1 Tax=Micromonospora thermarum TaxID=2720024 RepID=A0ABX0Z8H7_9ACTN|nr:PQQ-dependent sugar dehydrogenase [Micromonospora thermarum]NJP33564.1 PQQ-dependent sugar dehydrogenase [Micromonospora thermarum]
MRRRNVVAGVVLTVCVGVAGAPTAPAAAMAGAAGPAGATAGAPTAATGWRGVDLTRPEVVATGLEVPWGLAFLPDGSALVAERNSGRVLRVRRGSAPQQVARIAGVSAVGESGLLGLAVSPRYRSDGYVYAFFTSAVDNRIVRFRLTAPQVQQPILTGLARASVHNGGRIAFGPDGLLYAGVGDAGVAASAQDPRSRNGKILRLRPDGGVPGSNPIAGSLVYSLGHRNVQGLAWDWRGRLYATEFGASTWDEVNRIVPGGNYGWPVVEGVAGDPRFRDPVVTWRPAEASPSGAAIVGGNVLYVAALRGARLWVVPLDWTGGAGTPTAHLVGVYGRLRTVVRAPDGSLWVTTSNRDGRGTPAADDDRIVRFPPAWGWWFPRAD